MKIPLCSLLLNGNRMHQGSVAKMLASDQIKLDRLKLISKLPGYNFLRALADKIKVNEPPKYTMESATRERFRELEIENATLLKVLGKLIDIYFLSPLPRDCIAWFFLIS